MAVLAGEYMNVALFIFSSKKSRLSYERIYCLSTEHVRGHFSLQLGERNKQRGRGESDG